MTRRSEETRAAILAAARSQFAANGFRGTTIRAIGADAEIDPAMVMRYFGNKAGLFAAAVDTDLRLPDLTGVARSKLGETLVGHFFDRWEGDPSEVMLTLLRSAVSDDSAADRMRNIFATQLLPVVRSAVDDPSTAPHRAGLIATQMLGLALGRHLLRLPPVVGASREELVRQLGPTVQRYLRGPL